MIEIKNVSIRYGNFEAVQGVDFTIYDGEFFTLLGPSGCGKTTTLRAIAGFEKVAQKEQALEKQLKDEKIDVTMPSTALAVGHLHPLTQIQRRIEEIFIGMGFSIAEGPEVEYDYYNFQALNIPENHPARDTQDTFYITENILLR